MDYFKTHVGNVRQKLREDEAEDVETYGVSPQLKVPEIVLPEDADPVQLHGDVEGSPYSSTPGKISLAEAHEQVTGKAKDDVGVADVSRAAPPKPDPEPRRSTASPSPSGRAAGKD